MKMFNFDLLRDGPSRRAVIETANAQLADLGMAIRHAQNLLAARGKAIGATAVRIRENGGPALWEHP